MLDFDREDQQLREQVGADSRQILTAASASWADRFYLARERMLELAAERDASPETVLERDRLASYFGCAYGRGGLLARAWAMLALRERMQRLAVLGPKLVADPSSMGRLRREAVLTRTFARLGFGRAPEGSVERAVLEAVRGAATAAVSCADFVAAAAAIDTDREVFVSTSSIYAASELAWLAADESPQRHLLATAAFALSLWANAREQRASEGPFDALVEAHLAGLRDALWSAVEAQLAAGDAPVALAALEGADRDLEALLAPLSGRRHPGAERARVLADLMALAATTRAVQAQALANRALEGTLGLLAEGLAAEEGGAR